MFDLFDRPSSRTFAVLLTSAALGLVAQACGASGRGNAGADDPTAADGGPLDAGGPALFGDATSSAPAVGTCHATGDTATQLLSRSAPVGLPRLVWNGARYAAIWYDDTRGAGGFDVYFAFASEDGVLDASTIRQVSPDAAHGTFARIAFSGTEYGVVYQATGASGSKAHFTRVSAAGEVITGADIEVPGTAAQSNPAIAWNPARSEWGVAWTDGSSAGHTIATFSPPRSTDPVPAKFA